MNVIDYVIVFGFLAVTFYVGSVFYSWVGGTDDFYVAGRRLTPFILAAVLTATNVNLYSFVGQAGIVYKSGISILWQTWTGNMALVFSGLFVLPILRRLRIRTIPEFLQLRYSKGARTFVALIWIVRLSFWLGIISYTAAIAAEPITGFHSFTFWLIVFSIFAIVYTTLGGMWSVAFTDVMQFVFMLFGALIVLPVAMALVGWWPGVVAKVPPEALKLVTAQGQYNWKFILAIFFLGIEWACVDQGMLQRAFAAESAKTVVRGLVLAGIITTPFALLWNLPGLPARILFPGLANADMAIPMLLTRILPNGILGLVVCGLLSSHLSTISANLNGVATIFASDLYENVFKKSGDDKGILRVARIVTAVTGAVMIAFAYVVPLLGGAVNAYLTIIAMLDMPLFVVAIVYGLLWRRTNWQGAITGYAAGALAGMTAQFLLGYDFTVTTFISAGATLFVTPVASLLTRNPEPASVGEIWNAKQGSDEETRTHEAYHILPHTFAGKLGLGIFAAGFLVFITGVLLGSVEYASASFVAVCGMIVYFAGGLLRAYTN